MARFDRTLLIVDCDRNHADRYQHWLNNDAGRTYSVLMLSDDNSVVELCRTQVVDGILLNAEASGDRALDLLVQLKAQMGEHSPPVIVLGRDNVNLAVRSLKAGAVDYLVQDQLTADTLRQAVETAIAADLRDTQRLHDLAARLTTEGDIETLRESEARLQFIANLVPDLLWDSEPDGSTNWYNQRWMEYTGQTFEQAIGWGWIDAIHPDDRATSARRYHAAVQQGVQLQQEHRIRRYDSEYRWFVVKASPLKDESGRVVKMYGAATDIHDQRVALEALRESEEKFRTLADTAPALIWFNDAQGENRFINQHFVDFTGKSAEQIRGEGWHGLVHPDEAEAYIADYLVAVREQRPWHNRNRIRRHDGVWRWHENYARPLFSADGVYLGHVGVTIDNTDVIEAEIALRASETKYRSLFNSIDEGFCIIELIDDEAGRTVDYRFLEVNPVFERLTGVKNVIGKTDKELNINTEPHWLDSYGRVARTGEPLRLENYHAPTEHWYQAYISRVGGEGSRQIAIVFDDITDRKQAERALTRTNELLQATFDNSLQIIQLFKAVRDESGNIVDFEWLLTNKQWNDQWGEMAGKRLLRENPAVIETGLFEMFKQVTESGVPVMHEHYYAHEQFDGCFLQTIAQVEDGFLLSTLDTTERKLAEEALRASEAKYRSLFNSIDQGFCIIEMIFDENEKPIDYRFLEVNPAFEHQTGLVAAQGKRMRELAPDHEEHWFEIYGHVALTGEPIRFENVAAQLHRWYDVYAFRSGEPESRKVAILFKDISDRKRAEANLAFLAEISQDLARLTSIDETMNALGEKIGGHFNVSACVFAELSETAETAVINYTWQLSHMPSFIGTYRMQDFVAPEVLRLYRAGEAVVIRDVFNDPLVDGEQYAALNIGSFLSIPLIRDGEWRFLLVIYHTEPHDWRDDEIELTHELANRIWTRLERARAEESLTQSEAKYRSLFNSIDQGFCIIEMIFDENEKPTDYRFLEVNPAFEHQTGLVAAQGKRMRELAPDHEEHWFEIYGHVALTGEPIQFENVAAQLHRWYDVYAFRSGEPESRKVAILFKDISDRKRRERHQKFLLKLNDALRPLSDPLEIQQAAMRIVGEALQVDRVLYADITPDGNMWVTQDNYTSGRLPKLIGSFPTAAFGASVEPLRRGEVVAYPDVEKATDLTEAEKALYREYDTRSVFGVPLFKEGHWISNIGIHHAEPRQWEESEIALVQETVERTWAAVERARAEAALQQMMQKVQALNKTLEQRVQARTAQLEAINQELDAFSYSVSHDLQTPLRYIHSFVERLQTKLNTDQADASSLRYLGIIEEAAGQAHKMINDLLQFSRMGKTPLNMVRVSMAELVEQVRSQLEPETIDRTIDWQIKPLPEVEGDPDLLRLVVQNLLSNAVKYTRDCPTATITIGSNAYDHEIVFFVQDNGAGFDMKYQDRLFSLFQRLHSQEQFAGTGVGLANVRRIIHRHGGRVWAEGAVDQGATFYVSLPKQEVIG